MLAPSPARMNPSGSAWYPHLPRRANGKADPTEPAQRLTPLHRLLTINPRAHGDTGRPGCAGQQGRAAAMNNHKLRVFSGRANRPLAEKIAHCLGDNLGDMVVTNFPDTETSVKINEDVRGRDVFV